MPRTAVKPDELESIFFTVAEIAQAMRCSEDTVIRQIDDCQLDAVRFGRRILITKQSFLAHIRRELRDPGQLAADEQRRQEILSQDQKNAVENKSIRERWLSKVKGESKAWDSRGYVA